MLPKKKANDTKGTLTLKIDWHCMAINEGDHKTNIRNRIQIKNRKKTIRSPPKTWLDRRCSRRVSRSRSTSCTRSVVFHSYVSTKKHFDENYLSIWTQMVTEGNMLTLLHRMLNHFPSVAYFWQFGMYK